MTELTIITDEDLVAYLDNQLGPAKRDRITERLAQDATLGQRLAALSVDTEELKAAFDPLLAHTPEPIPVLASAAAAAALLDSAGSTRAASSNHFGWTGLQAAALLVAVGVGLLIGVGVSGSGGLISAGTPVWQQAVADYQRLYLPVTLPAEAPDEASTQAQLLAVSEHAGLNVSPAMVGLPGLDFRRAQPLGLEGKPLVQLAFATSDGQPVALCFFPNDQPASEPAPLTIAGLNAVSWRNGRFDFLIIGPVDSTLLASTAEVAANLY